MGLNSRTLLVLGSLTLALAACSKPATPPPNLVKTEDSDPIRVELDQRWTPAIRAVWYEQTQGSRIMPLSWFLALEDDNGKPLLSPERIQAWGYLPHKNSAGRELPIGFTEDDTPDAQLPKPLLTWRKGGATKEDRIWVGMNCSACHTAQLTYKGKIVTVDGGPALSNFEGFLADIRASLDATEKDDKRFDRFADRVLGKKPLEAWTPGLTAEGAIDAVKDTFTKGPEDDKGDRALLRAALSKVALRERELNQLNKWNGQADYGRLDAFGHIFNKVAWMAAGPAQPPNPSDAPVSYPFLWNVPQHDRVQWNGIAPKRVVAGEDLGALLRNGGEVIGVFADIQIAKNQAFYPSSMNIPGLKALEAQLTVLRPPAWPASVFGWNTEVKDAAGAPVTHEKLVADGKAAYLDPKKGDCVSCHKLLPSRDDITTPIAAQMAMFNPKTKVAGNIHESAGTDIWMACNAYTKTAPTGLMKGVPSPTGPLGDTASLAQMTQIAVAGAVFRRAQGLEAKFEHPLIPPPILAALINLATPPKPPAPSSPAAAKTPEERCLTETKEILGYKGRPLNGIWATAPFLHNGSVRTLYQLLLPADQREATFEVGNREFDPKEVGYVRSTAGNHSTLNTTAHANSNAGHDYGNAGLSDYDRWALIEYLKTL